MTQRPALPFTLDEQLCFALYSTSLAMTKAYKPLLDKLGLTYPQYLVLCVLGEAEEATIGAIAGRLALESSTVTPTVQRLEQAGLVTRQRSTDDERKVRVRLTGAGRALLARSSCLGETLMARSGMTALEMGTLNRRVRALRDALAED